MISRIFCCGRLFAQPYSVEFSISAVSGVLIAAWLHQTVALLGTSLTATMSLILVAGISVVAGLFAASGLASFVQPVWAARKSPLPPLVLMGIAGLLSGQMVLIQSTLLTIFAPDGRWPDGIERFLLFVASQCPLIVPLASAICSASVPVQVQGNRSCGLTAKSLVGLATGIVITSFGLMPFAGADLTVYGAVACVFILAAATFRLGRSGEAGNTDPVDLPASLRCSISIRIHAAFLAGSYGVAFTCVSRIFDQLFFDAAWITAAEYAFLLTGGAIGLRAARRTSLATMTALWTSVCLAVTVALFPAAIAISLEISSYVPHVAGVALARSALIAAAVLPLGAAAALSGVQFPSGKSSVTSVTIVSFLCGIIAARCFVISAISPATALAVVVCCLALSSLARLILDSGFRQLATQPALAAALAAGLVASVTVPFWTGQYQPERAARLLFDTGVFLAHRVELRTEILEHLDEARCLGSFESDDGTLSLWRTRGTQLQIRKSGMPLSLISANTSVAPQPSGEALQTILPLILHDRPQSILIVGLGAGTTLQTALQFPVSQILCTETDAGLIDLVRRKIYAKVSPSPLNDARVRIISCEPVLATACARNVDVIVCSSPHFSQPGSASEATAEFLTRASSGLSEGGLFCQQFRYVDFGAETVRSVFATWESVFRHVAAIETAPGEWLLLGTQSETGLFREGLVERLQRSHVRHALSRIGFDWATPLQLSVLEGKRLQQHCSQLAAQPAAPPVQTASSASMLAAGPWDVMRWGAKFAEIQTTIGPAARRLAAEFPMETANADVQRRLGELDSRRDLIHDATDRYWAYRGELKRKLKESPRAEIVQVSGGQETRLHPEEQRRIDYFKSLGTAASLELPTARSLLPIEQFFTPYDPFVSFFMHEEIAELAARNSKSNFAIEFSHRLYRVNFTSARDNSIRNLIATIHLLCDHVELIPDDAERGDQLDALLQILHRRWQNRGDVRPQSTQIAMHDIEKSLEAGEKAFEVLRELGAARGKTDDEIALRKQVLEKSLMRPLRTYRNRLLKRQDLNKAIGSN